MEECFCGRRAVGSVERDSRKANFCKEHEENMIYEITESPRAYSKELK